MLEALRQREQDVIRYIAILAPALGGYVWLLKEYGTNTTVFVAGTLGVILLLFVGAVYTVALGYNFRYITLQLAKLETLIDTRDFILAGWPRDAKVFAKKYGRWCCPPEVIRVFWLAFLFAIAGVTVSGSAATKDHFSSSIIIAVGGSALGVSLITPVCYGRKIKRKCRKERQWNPIELAPSGDTGEQDQTQRTPSE